MLGLMVKMLLLNLKINNLYIILKNVFYAFFWYRTRIYSLLANILGYFTLNYSKYYKLLYPNVLLIIIL
jgi:hypothetical protein